MSHLFDIFLQPDKAFAGLRERPTWLLPLSILLAFSAALPLFYFLSVDGAWYTQQMLASAGRELSAADAEKMQAMMPGAQRLAVVGAISAALVGLIVSCLYALYLMLAGKITGAAIDFRRGLTLACWSKMPMLLGMVVVLVGVSRMSPQTSLESLMLTNADPLLFHMPTQNPWSALARAFSLLDFWVWGLMALGWRTFARASWTQSIVVSVLPSVLFFAILAAVAMFKS